MFDKGVNTGYQQLTVTTGATSLTLPLTGSTEAALIRTSGSNLRFTLSGVAPTGTTGYPLFPADTQGIWLWGLGNLINFKAIAPTGTATVDVLYFGLRE